jgi:ankyrin repeat protein
VSILGSPFFLMQDHFEDSDLQESRTPLHHACEEGHVEAVVVLLAAGAALEARDHVSAISMR